MPERLLALAIVHDDARILLGLEKRGPGSGRWRGFGGEIGAGEAPEAAAVRAVRETCGLEALSCEMRGRFRRAYACDPVELDVRVFSVRVWRGEPRETEALRPAWFRQTDVPYDEMRADGRYWLPLLLRGRPFEGEFRYLDREHLLHHRLETPSLATV